jgi:hypothetical protein
MSVFWEKDTKEKCYPCAALRTTQKANERTGRISVPDLLGRSNECSIAFMVLSKMEFLTASVDMNCK